MTELRVLIVADDPLARAGLAAMLQREDSLKVIGQISPDTTPLDTFSYDIMVLDLGWEPERALAMGNENILIDATTPLVILMPDSEYMSDVLTIMSNVGHGTSFGLLARNAPANVLAAALSSTAEGLITLDPALNDGNMPFITATTSPEDKDVDRLTPREQEVLNLLAEGLPNKVIAVQLHISEYTVKFHVNSILSKLKAGSRTEAVVRATRLGLVSL